MANAPAAEKLGTRLECDIFFGALGDHGLESANPVPGVRMDPLVVFAIFLGLLRAARPLQGAHVGLWIDLVASGVLARSAGVVLRRVDLRRRAAAAAEEVVGEGIVVGSWGLGLDSVPIRSGQRPLPGGRCRAEKPPVA